jgi:altronate hydrolase
MNNKKKQTFAQIHPADNVLVALQDLKKGTEIYHNGLNFDLKSDISAKHKFTTGPLSIGEEVTMYGVIVGKATQNIAQGDWISTANLVHESEKYSLDNRRPKTTQTPDVSKWRDRTFMGYHRSDGTVGTRNFWLVIPLVFCENRNILMLKDAFERELGFAQPEKYRWQVRQMLDLYKNGKAADIENLTFLEENTTPSVKSAFFPNVELRLSSLGRSLCGFLPQPECGGHYSLEFGLPKNTN